MKTTPFLGLSVLVHLLVILFFRVFGRCTIREPTSRVRSSSRAESFLIIISIFVLIGINAISLLWSVLAEKHSTLHLAQNVIQEWAQTNPAGTVVTRAPPSFAYSH